MSAADPTHPPTQNAEPKDFPSLKISPEPIFTALGQKIEKCISEASETKTKLAGHRSAHAIAMLQLDTEMKAIKAKPENARKRLDQSRRTMRQHTHILAKIDSISEELDPTLEQVLSFQRQHAAQADFWEKLTQCHRAQSLDEMDSEADVKRVDDMIVLVDQFGPALTQLTDLLSAISWTELEMASTQPTSSTS